MSINQFENEWRYELGASAFVCATLAMIYTITAFLAFKALLSDLDALAESHINLTPLTSSSAKLSGKNATSIPDLSGMYEVSAYNAGDPRQTDDEPCIAANGENICLALARGEKRCAANFVPLNSYLWIDGYGICKVSDRMAKRFTKTVDIAFQAHEIRAALEFGRQKRFTVPLNWD